MNATTAAPASFQWLVEKAVAAHRRNDWPRAESLYTQALRLQPENPEPWHLLGLLSHQTGRSQEAVEMIGRAIALNPTTPEYHSNCGIAWRALGDLPKAISCYQEALRLQPAYADACYNLGNAFKDLGRLEEAVACFRRAETLQPGFPDVATNCGAALKELARLDEALTCYNEALQRQPDYPEARWNRGIVRLLRGEFREGWEDYEWRWKVRGLLPSKRTFRQPEWDGSSLAGKTILIHAEQGFGDTIQFARYGPLLSQCGAIVYLECQPALKRLLQTLPGVAQVIAQGEPLPKFDLHAPLLRLPGLCGTVLESIPAHVPYLSAPKRGLVQFEALANARLKVGIAWRGNPENGADRHRSLQLEKLGPILEIPGVAFYSLQCGPAAAEIRTLATPARVQDLGPQLHDFAATADAVMQMDLVISVCTSVAHLAGALGKPTWTLLAANACWRWLLEREDNPWYPTMRLFRQKKLEDWQPVIERVSAELEAKLARRR